MRRAALLLAALAALLAPRGTGGDEVVPAFVDEAAAAQHAAAHTPRGHEFHWNYTLLPHMMARSVGHEVRRSASGLLRCAACRSLQRADAPRRGAPMRCGVWWPSWTRAAQWWSRSSAAA